jgi:hypothetical protein
VVDGGRGGGRSYYIIFTMDAKGDVDGRRLAGGKYSRSRLNKSGVLSR